MLVKTTNDITSSKKTGYSEYIIVMLWVIFAYFIFGQEINIFFTLLNIPVSFLMYLIGKAFRNFTMPTVFTSNGAWDTFSKKVFWMIGPQIISMGIGTYVLYCLMCE